MTTVNKSSEAHVSEAQLNGAAASLNAADLIDSISAEQLADVFRSAGYRVTMAEQNGIAQLMSASQGVGFVARFGNPIPAERVRAGDDTPLHLDYTLSCAMQVQGELPADLVASWNRTKRFARLAAHAQFLVLEMDVVVAGGVSSRHLLSTIELWDRLIQEFLLHLRNRPAMAAAEQDARTSAQRESGADSKAQTQAAQAAQGAGDATLQ